MQSKMELEKYDFIEVGRWVLSNKGKSGINFELYKLADRRVVYAFVVDDVPKYIGICEKDTTTLKDRMSRYKNQQGGNRQTESTNKRVTELIKKCLVENKSVRIFAILSERTFDFVDLKVDLVKGLENQLIMKFKPEWNK